VILICPTCVKKDITAPLQASRGMGEYFVSDFAECPECDFRMSALELIGEMKEETITVSEGG